MPKPGRPGCFDRAMDSLDESDKREILGYIAGLEALILVLERQYSSNGLNRAMDKMPKEWRGKWCESKNCACLGCANISGGLAALGYSKDEHSQWLLQNHD